MTLKRIFTITALAALGLTFSQAHAALYSDGAPVSGSITIDGDMADWSSDMQVGTDPSEAGIESWVDLNTFYMANDETYLYGRYAGDDPLSTSGNFNRRVYYLMDTDNNVSTGIDYHRFDGHSAVYGRSGLERELRMAMANDTKPAWDQLYADTDSDELFEQVSSDYTGATEPIPSGGATGREWRISLADLGITGNTTIRYLVFQNFAGDMFGGTNWDVEPLESHMQTYQVTMVPEPATMSLLGLGAGLALLRRRRHA